MKENYPLIIVFYLDVEMMKIKDIIEPFAKSVNAILAEKESNAIAFFLPTTGAERVECINPTVIPQVDMDKIYGMIGDITKAFSIGSDMKDVPDIEVTPDEKKCNCENNDDCNCDI